VGFAQRRFTSPTPVKTFLWDLFRNPIEGAAIRTTENHASAVHPRDKRGYTSLRAAEDSQRLRDHGRSLIGIDKRTATIAINARAGFDISRDVGADLERPSTAGALHRSQLRILNPDAIVSCARIGRFGAHRDE
jgi:hypothetical protein